MGWPKMSWVGPFTSSNLLSPNSHCPILIIFDYNMFNLNPGRIHNAIKETKKIMSIGHFFDDSIHGNFFLIERLKIKNKQYKYKPNRTLQRSGA